MYNTPIYKTLDSQRLIHGILKIHSSTTILLIPYVQSHRQSIFIHLSKHQYDTLHIPNDRNLPDNHRSLERPKETELVRNNEPQEIPQEVPSPNPWPAIERNSRLPPVGSTIKISSLAVTRIDSSIRRRGCVPGGGVGGGGRDTSQPSVPRDSTSLRDVRSEAGYDVLGFHQFGDTQPGRVPRRLATGLLNLLRNNTGDEAVNNMENRRERRDSAEHRRGGCVRSAREDRDTRK